MENKILVLDIETTGLDIVKDEILSLSILDEYENVLYNSYFRPVTVEDWVEAERIHGISWKDVENAPTFKQELEHINDLLSSGYILVGYNLDAFDLPFLKNNGVNLVYSRTVDLMRCFSGIYGEWIEKFYRFRFKNLTDCAAYYGYEFKSHDSPEDVKATLFCYKKMITKACQVSKTHRKTCEVWYHGDPVAYTKDYARNNIVIYEDGTWWHYTDDGAEWW